jgi:hypothetical protein
MRVAHGSTLPVDGVENPTLPSGPQLPGPSRFGFLFPKLAEDPNSLLPVSSDTLASLSRLGETMRDPGIDLRELNADKVHSAYTYLGQFIIFSGDLFQAKFTMSYRGKVMEPFLSCR